MTGPHYTNIVASLPATVPFVGPETQERQLGRKYQARLGANESVFGPSPLAIEAMKQAAHEVWKYGDAENYDLRNALAKFHNVRPENILVGEGIDGLLGYLVRLMVEPGNPVVTSDGAYPTFGYHVAGYGGVLHKVPFKGHHEDHEALIAKAAEVDAKLVYLSNPDNPMGSWHSGDEIRKAVDNVPDGTLLVLDEAYVELAPEGTALEIDIEDPRVIRMRTFSKAYGLAGARIGYALGAENLIAAFNKVRNHFGVSRISQAGALAALRDQEWLAHIRAEVAQARDRINKIVQQNGFSPLPSATNFVTADSGQDADFVQALVQALADQGVFVRTPFVAPHNRCLRISAGQPDELAILETELPIALAEIQGT